MRESLYNPFSGSKTEIETTLTERKYNKLKEDGKLDGHSVEDENEYYILLVDGVTKMGTIVRKKFNGYNIK